MAQDPPVARTTLEHVWPNVDLWLPVLLTDQTATFSLCYFAVGEGLDHLIIKWATVERNFNIQVPNGRRADRRWRGVLLRGLCRAYSIHTMSYDLNDALETFFYVHEKGLDSRERGFDLGLDLAPVANILTNTISTGAYYRTSAVLYDRFVSMARHILRQKHNNERYAVYRDKDALDMARLGLYHPVRPDASLAQDVLNTRSHILPPMLQEPLSRRALLMFLVRTVLVAETKNQPEVAAAASKKHRELFGANVPSATEVQAIVGLSWRERS